MSYFTRLNRMNLLKDGRAGRDADGDGITGEGGKGEGGSDILSSERGQGLSDSKLYADHLSQDDAVNVVGARVMGLRDIVLGSSRTMGVSDKFQEEVDSARNALRSNKQLNPTYRSRMQRDLKVLEAAFYDDQLKARLTKR